MNLILVGIALPWLLIVFGGWLFCQFLRQNGRLLLRLEAIEDYLEQLAGDDAERQPAGKSRRPLSERRHSLRDSCNLKRVRR